ncbi:MAG: hypothetical protein CSA39_01350 [Flavobacteriales bacterium]|nr:MAG: hypothetical protein CR989_02135 [Flavobacteriales bacterium]PIE49691.1 MAG: hypothetical protein CSA39_01350 [Flavobacteriales bacterium]
MGRKNKENNDVIRKIMKSYEAKQPSLSFTEKLMETITAEQKLNYAYWPLISKRGWAALSLLTAVLISYLLFFRNLDRPEWFSYLDIPLHWITISELSGTFFYAILILGLCLFAQIIFIKNYFNKKLKF